MASLRIAGREYDAPESFTLGELRALKREFGLAVGDVEAALDQGDPDAIAWLVWVCLTREDPAVTVAAVLALDLAVIGQEAEPGPPAAGGAEASPTSPPASSGRSPDGPSEPSLAATGSPGWATGAV